VNALRCLDLRLAWRHLTVPNELATGRSCTKRPRPDHNPGTGLSYPSGDQRGASMCKTLKTDITLFAAAIVAAALVLGADVSLADIVSTLSGAN
jgi:hypothetical protein